MVNPNLIFETNKIMVFQQQLGRWDNLNHLFVCKSTKKACIVDPFDGEYWYDFCRLHDFQLSERNNSNEGNKNRFERCKNLCSATYMICFV